MRIYIRPGHLSAPPPAAPNPNTAGFRSFIGWRFGGLSVPATPAPIPPVKKVVGWPFTHDPEELERRLREQRGDDAREWIERYLKADDEAKERIAETKGRHRAALEAAVERVAARVAEAREANAGPPVSLILLLEAAAGARRATASIKNAERAIQLAAAYFDDEDEDAIEMLLLH